MARICHPVGAGAVARQILIERARDCPAAPPFRKCNDPEHPHGAVKRNRQYVAGFYRLAGRVDPHSIAPNASGRGKRAGSAPRAHYPRVPQPLIDPLTALSQGQPEQSVRWQSMPILGIRFELRLEGGKLGEG